MFYLIGQERKLQDRSRDQVREHRDEAGKIDEVRHRFGFATVNVDRVAERLEGVEANPERKDDAKERVELRVLKTEGLDEVVVTLDPEVEVLEETKRREIQQDRNQDRALLRVSARSAARQLFHRFAPDAPELPGVVRDDQADQPIHKRRREHERHEARFGPAVKNVAGENEPGISPALARPPKRVVAEQRDRQEMVNEDVRAKNHAAVPEPTARCELKTAS